MLLLVLVTRATVTAHHNLEKTGQYPSKSDIPPALFGHLSSSKTTIAYYGEDVTPSRPPPCDCKTVDSKASSCTTVNWTGPERADNISPLRGLFAIKKVMCIFTATRVTQLYRREVKKTIIEKEKHPAISAIYKGVFEDSRVHA